MSQAKDPPASEPVKGGSVSRRSLLRVLAAGTAAVPLLAWTARALAGRSAAAQTVLSDAMAGTAVMPGGTSIAGITDTTASAAPTEPQGRLRRWAMVIDLRRCDGCQSVGKPPQCTAACIQGHYAPEPMEWIQVFEADLHGGGTQFIPLPCQHCQNPPCVNVCPVAATFSTPEGPVLIDHYRCIGCRMCMAACPYDRRFFTWGTSPQPPEALAMKLDVEQQSPAQRGTTMKCDFCPDMARAGRLPYCADACPNHAIYYGDLEEGLATNGREVVEIYRFLEENSAYRQKEELGTEPRVFYIPGHGEAVGRSAFTRGRMKTVWPWQNVAKGAAKWTR
jgi:dimethyl sulfoxide reductase iron-sulfur subunit